MSKKSSTDSLIGALSELKNGSPQKRPQRKAAQSCKRWMHGLFAKRARPEVVEENPFDLLIGNGSSEKDPKILAMRKELDSFSKLMKELGFSDTDLNSSKNEPFTVLSTEEWEEYFKSLEQKKSDFQLRI